MRGNLVKWIWILFFVTSNVSFADCSKNDKKIVNLCTYLSVMPFLPGERFQRSRETKDKGLIMHFVDLFNQKEGASIWLDVSFYPKRRLEKMLMDGERCIVPFVHSHALDIIKTGEYLLSPPLFHERHEIISLKSSGLEFDGRLELFAGMELVQIRASNHLELNSLINDHLINVHEVADYDALLQMLIRKRADFAVIPRTIVNQYLQKTEYSGQFSISRQPLKVYTRHFLLPPDMKDEANQLFDFVSNLHNSKEWTNAIHNLGLVEEMIDSFMVKKMHSF